MIKDVFEGDNSWRFLFERVLEKNFKRGEYTVLQQEEDKIIVAINTNDISFTFYLYKIKEDPDYAEVWYQIKGEKEPGYLYSVNIYEMTMADVLEDILSSM